MSEWYVDTSRVRVNWSTAVTGGTAAIRINRLVDDGTHQNLYLWAAAGQPVTAGQLAAAQAAESGSAVPAAQTPPDLSPAAWVSLAMLADDVLAAIETGGSSGAVHTTGAETIDGVKTFTSSPSVPSPSGTGDAANRSYVDTAMSSRIPTSQKGAASGVATLDGAGLIPTAQLPPLAINTVTVVASQAAMLALTAERGDVAVRSDTGKTLILATDSPSTLADWKEILATGQVVSVNGSTGVVVLNAASVGLGGVDNTSDAAKPVSTATQTALNAKAPLSSPAFTGTPAAPTAPAGTNTTQVATTAFVTLQGNRAVRTVGFTPSCDYVCDGAADDVQIQAALNDVAAAGGGTVYLRAGTYDITATLTSTASGIRLAGEGMGITTLLANASMSGDTPILEFGPNSGGTDRTVTVSTAVGDTTITVSTGDAATFVVGDMILLKSSKLIDSESATKKAGELHQVTAIDTGTGVLTVNDIINDTYLTSDTAQITRVSIAKNVHVADLTCASAATSSTLTRGFAHFRFINNLNVRAVEIRNAYHSMQIRSCLNGRVEGCYIHDISDVTPSSNLRYGIWVASATQNFIINGCRFSQVRHAVTTGGVSGTNYNGVQRQITISNCTSMQADTAHFDTHEGSDGVQITNCAAIGGMSYGGAAQAVIGIQSRGKNVSITGCVVKNIPGRGIMIFNPNSHATAIVGCHISGIKQSIGGGDGIGIYFDSAGAGRHLVSGCVIRDCDSRAITGGGGNNDVVVTGCVIDNSPAVVSNASVYFSNALRVAVIGNKISNNSLNRPVQMSGTSDNWTIADNHFYNNSNNNPALTGTNSAVFNNFGANPRAPYAVGNATGATTFNRANGHYQTATLTGNITVTLSAGLAIGDELILVLTQDGTGSRTATWPGNAKLAGGTLTLTAAAAAVDAITFLWDGTNWRERSRALALA